MLSNIPHEHKPLLVLSAIVLAMLALFLAFKTWLTFAEAIQVGKPVPYEYTVNIEGVGVAQAKPDVSKITFYVESKKSTLEEAQKDNSTRTNALLEKLTALGMEKKDVQSSYYNSYENQIYDDKTMTHKSFGWIVSQSLEVTIRDLEKISLVLEMLGQNGASNISGPNFSVENDSTALQEARIKALADAKNRAQTIAKELGVKLGSPNSYSEYKEDVPGYGYAMKGEMMDASGSVAPTIEPGQNSIKLHVTVSYVLER